MMRIFVAFLATVAFVVTASAQVSLNRAIWIGNAYDHVTRTDNNAHWSSLEMIGLLYSGQRKIGEKEGRYTINYFRWRAEDAYKTYGRSAPSINGFEFANSVYETVKDPTIFNAAGETLKYLLKKIVTAPDQQLTSWQNYNREFYDKYFGKDYDKREILGRIYDEAQHDVEFAKLFDETYGSLVNAKLTDSAPEILETNPDFATSEMIRDLVKGTGDLDRRIKDIQKVVGEKLKEVATLPSKLAPDTVKNQRESDALAQIVEQQTAAKISAQEEFENRGLHSAVLVVSEFIGDPKTAKQFDAVANAIIDTRSLVAEFNRLYSGQDDSARSIGVAAASFNYIAIFLSVVDALSEKGPPPEAIVLEQVQALAKQMQRFQQENRERFDRVDAELSSIFVTMNSEFDDLANKINNVDYDIQTVRNSMAQTLMRLDQIEVSLTNYLLLVADESFESMMKRCIGYADRTGHKMDRGVYDGCVTSILSYIDDAETPALSGEDANSAGPETFGSLVEPSKTAAQVNFYISLAAERGHYSAFKRVANPVRWARAANAYSRLAVENDDVFRSTPLKALNDIVDEGEMIDRTLSSELPFSKGKFAQAIDSLVGEYKSQLAIVESTAATVAQRAISGKATTTWLTPLEYASKISQFKSSFANREIPHAGKWPILEPFWTKNIPLSIRDVIRGEGIPFHPLFKSFSEYQWGQVLADPSLAALEFLGFGRLELRYMPDVSVPTLVGTPCCSAVWGFPYVTIFVYLLPPNSTIPDKPLGLLPYRNAFYSVMWVDPCGGGVGPVLCKNLRVYSNNPLPTMQFDWSAFLSTESSLARHKVVVTPTIVPRVEQRLDELLVDQHKALVTEVERKDSDLYRAVSSLDSTVNALRGLLALTLPGPISRDDDLRATLFGIEDEERCAFSGSRIIWAPTPEISNFMSTVLDQNQLGKMDAPPVAPVRISSSPTASCGPVVARGTNEIRPLLDRKGIKRLLASAFDQSGESDPKLLNEANMLKSVGRLGSEAADSFRQVSARAISDLSVADNHHGFVQVEINKLKALRNSKSYRSSR